ncbi:hypothetical protein CEXT_630251 [Caerostris extrusa]|uniref:Uncharacterized protein n=1 Tax=Caerostris extrusa TaxID=172846 RepID=A0AAV4XWB3_CAEEX|nr:hypothetical protein CEXT_630251 [Caerostris extrusa]
MSFLVNRSHQKGVSFSRPLWCLNDSFSPLPECTPFEKNKKEELSVDFVILKQSSIAAHQLLISLGDIGDPVDRDP